MSAISLALGFIAGAIAAFIGLAVFVNYALARAIARGLNW